MARPISKDFKLTVSHFGSPKRYPHRCMRRLSKGSEFKKTRKCLTQRTFAYGENPPCPTCGSTIHWTINTHESMKKTKKKYYCNCDAYPHKHTIFGRECVNNPRRDEIEAEMEAEYNLYRAQYDYDEEPS